MGKGGLTVEPELVVRQDAVISKLRVGKWSQMVSIIIFLGHLALGLKILLSEAD